MVKAKNQVKLEIPEVRSNEIDKLLRNILSPGEHGVLQMLPRYIKNSLYGTLLLNFLPRVWLFTACQNHRFE